MVISHETKINKMKIQKKGRYKMVAKKITMSLLVLMCFSLVQNISFSAGAEPSEMEKQEYKQERTRIKALVKSLTIEPTNDLEKYEKFADEIQNKWKDKNKEYYARLMLKVCGPLTSGSFKDRRCYDLRRQYVLSALKYPNEIALVTELELTGRVQTDMYSRNAPKGADFAKRRRKDVQIRLHAWKRLVDAIDPNWDPNEILRSPNAVAASMGFPGTIAPESIKNPTLRAEYEVAIERNRQKIERYSEQSRLHKWLKRFPRHAEPYIIRAYSKPPFNLEELKQYLKKYIVDDKTRARILDAVTKNMEKQIQKTPKDTGVQ